jgi:hypothetical protein
MGGVSRFDCYPSDFLNGIIGLTADQIATYTVVMMMIYDRGKAIAYVGRERELQVRAGLTRTRLDKAIAHLVENGKLSVVDGCLENRRTQQELEKIRERIEKNRENSEKGGFASKRNWNAKHNENNGAIGPIGTPPASHSDSPILRPSSFVPQPGNTAPCGSVLDASHPKAKRKPVKSAIAEDQEPTDKDVGFAVDKGMLGECVKDEWAQFRDHHRKLDNRMVDWPAAWRNWVRNWKKFLPSAGSGGRAGRSNGMGELTKWVLKGIEDGDERRREKGTANVVPLLPVERR